jgi:hypothetical protein
MSPDVPATAIEAAADALVKLGAFKMPLNDGQLHIPAEAIAEVVYAAVEPYIRAQTAEAIEARAAVEFPRPCCCDDGVNLALRVLRRDDFYEMTRTRQHGTTDREGTTT